MTAGPGPGASGYQVTPGTLSQSASALQDCNSKLQLMLTELDGDCVLPPGVFALVDAFYGGSERVASEYARKLADTKEFVTTLMSRFAEIAAMLQTTADNYVRADSQATAAVAQVQQSSVASALEERSP
jgi:hypothetical protein